MQEPVCLVPLGLRSSWEGLTPFPRVWLAVPATEEWALFQIWSVLRRPPLRPTAAMAQLRLHSGLAPV